MNRSGLERAGTERDERVRRVTLDRGHQRGRPIDPGRAQDGVLGGVAHHHTVRHPVQDRIVELHDHEPTARRRDLSGD